MCPKSTKRGCVRGLGAPALPARLGVLLEAGWVMAMSSALPMLWRSSMSFRMTWTNLTTC